MSQTPLQFRWFKSALNVSKASSTAFCSGFQLQEVRNTATRARTITLDLIADTSVQIVPFGKHRVSRYAQRDYDSLNQIEKGVADERNR